METQRTDISEELKSELYKAAEYLNAEDVEERLQNPDYAAVVYKFLEATKSKMEEEVLSENKDAEVDSQLSLLEYGMEKAYTHLKAQDALKKLEPNLNSADDIEQDIPLKERINLITHYTTGALSGEIIDAKHLTDKNISLNIVHTMKELENIFNKPEEKRTEEEQENVQYYEEAYKDVVHSALTISNRREDRSFLVFLGEYERLATIDRLYENNDSALWELLPKNMDYENGMANPESIAYYIRRNYEDEFVENSKVSIKADVDIKHMACLDLYIEENGLNSLDASQKEKFSPALDILESIKENFTEEQREVFEKDKVRYKDLEFDNLPNSKNHLLKVLTEEGYEPDEVPGQWQRTKYADENSVKQVAYWNERLRERLIEENCATLDMFRKIGDIYAEKLKGSSYLSHSVVSKDEYGHPASTLYNVSPITGAMTFTKSGGQDPKAYEIAALNARTKGWSTVSLSYDGNFEEGVQFMKHSINALIDVAGYDVDQIKVPRKYKAVLKAAKDERFRIEQGDENKEEYVSVEELEQEEKESFDRQNEETNKRREKMIDENQAQSQSQDATDITAGSTDASGAKGSDEDLSVLRDEEPPVYHSEGFQEPRSNVEEPPFEIPDDIDLGDSEDIDPRDLGAEVDDSYEQSIGKPSDSLEEQPALEDPDLEEFGREPEFDNAEAKKALPANEGANSSVSKNDDKSQRNNSRKPKGSG